MSYRSLVSNKKCRRPDFRSGFGLVELMVSVSIMVLVSAIILVGQDSFNAAVLIRNQAYEIAFDLRETQLSAVSVSGDGGWNRQARGIHFNTVDGSDDTYIIFEDQNGNYFYDGTPTDRFITQARLDPRFEISSLNVGVSTPTQLSVVFERPNFDARFFSAGNNELTSDSVATIEVTKRGTSESRAVDVTTTGQISVQKY